MNQFPHFKFQMGDTVQVVINDRHQDNGKQFVVTCRSLSPSGVYEYYGQYPGNLLRLVKPTQEFVPDPAPLDRSKSFAHVGNPVNL